MKINNIQNNKFNNQNPQVSFEKKYTLDELIKYKRNPKFVDNQTKGEPLTSAILAAKLIKKFVPWIEKNIIQPVKKGEPKTKRKIEDLVNIGNVAKEAVCMVVYPVQVLTNPDLPKDKRRFVGIYDFFVTCVSLTGTLLFAWKGTQLSNKLGTTLMKKYLKNPKLYPRAERAAEGGGFVLGLLLQTILFKRVLAPALAPPAAGAVRRHLEAKDAAKAKAEEKAKNKGKDDVNFIPPEYNAALSVANSNQNLLNAFKDKNQM